MRKFICLAIVAVFFLVGVNISHAANDGKVYKVAISHYTTWEAAYVGKANGVFKKWGDKYGVKIDVSDFMDYGESIKLYTSGSYAGVMVTNMDTLNGPAVGGVDSEVIVVQDYSNGNDGFVVKNFTTYDELKKRPIRMMLESVSQYLFSRWIDKINKTEALKLKMSDFRLVHTSDLDILSNFINDEKGAIVTWNPPLLGARLEKGASDFFTSAEIPGEILDMLVMRADTPENVKKAFTGAWYELMSILGGHGKEKDDMIRMMAEAAGVNYESFLAQLKTTFMFYKPADAVKFVVGSQIKETMEKVRTVSFENGLMGNVSDKNFVGIQFPDGTVQGNLKNIKLRFTDKYMKMAAEGKL